MVRFILILSLFITANSFADVSLECSHTLTTISGENKAASYFSYLLKKDYLTSKTVEKLISGEIPEPKDFEFKNVNASQRLSLLHGLQAAFRDPLLKDNWDKITKILRDQLSLRTQSQIKIAEIKADTKPIWHELVRIELPSKNFSGKKTATNFHLRLDAVFSKNNTIYYTLDKEMALEVEINKSKTWFGLGKTIINKKATVKVAGIPKYTQDGGLEPVGYLEGLLNTYFIFKGDINWFVFNLNMNEMKSFDMPPNTLLPGSLISRQNGGSYLNDQNEEVFYFTHLLQGPSMYRRINYHSLHFLSIWNSKTNAFTFKEIGLHEPKSLTFKKLQDGTELFAFIAGNNIAVYNLKTDKLLVHKSPIKKILAIDENNSQVSIIGEGTDSEYFAYEIYGPNYQ